MPLISSGAALRSRPTRRKRADLTYDAPLAATLAGLSSHGGHMADEITGRDDYLIMQALVIARENLRDGKPSDASDMTKLLERRYPEWRRFFPPKPPEAV
jgi:hypothetical protein